MSNYVVYHLHSDLSNGVTNIDSVTKYNQYIDRAKECGMTALGFSEHGSVFSWLKKKEAIEKAGMKYVHAQEFYLTESLDEKVRDNWHCILIAKNKDGFREINKLSSVAFNRKNNHFYYTPRISLEELYSISDNVMVSTACLASVLFSGTAEAKESFLTFIINNKDRCYLEIQHHNVEEQKQYNKLLWSLSKEYGIPLITGTDTHALNDEHLEARMVLQHAKDVNFENENSWDLSFKTYDELVDAYKKQNSLPMDVVLEAIANTNKMADRVEPFDVDRSYKYPHLWSDPEAELKKRIQDGIVFRGIEQYPNYDEYKERIKYEFSVYKHNGAIDFILLMADIIDFCKQNDIITGWGRGSVNGSVICWLLQITQMDSIKHKLSFERFMNTERVSLADIDTDFPPSRRDEVKEYIVNRKGLHCSDIITFNTIATKGAVRDVVRGLYKNDTQKDYLEISNYICDNVETSEKKMRDEYPEVFKYVDIVNGVIVSTGSHPCGMVVSAAPLDEDMGLSSNANDPYPISQIYMKEIDSLNYVKLDLLALDTIEVIANTCRLANIPVVNPDTLDVYDDDVWNSMRDDTTEIFQWSGSTGDDYIKKLMSDQTIKKFKDSGVDVDKMTLLTIGNSAIRPAGASYRNELANGQIRKTGSQAIDEFLNDTFGMLVFQEQIIFFLNKFCGFTMGEADIVRRGFAKKTGTEQFIPRIKDGFIKTVTEKYGSSVEKAEEDIVAFLQVINDASDYLFSLNHSQPYSYEGYAEGWLRYHYPLEFVTVALNNCIGKEERTNGLTDYAKKIGIPIVSPKFRHSKAEYFCDKESNKIYKGIGSIKFMNDTVANEMYELRDNQYTHFTDLLYDLDEKTTLNSRQLDILIKLDFFNEFGDINKLLYVTHRYDELAHRATISRRDLDRFSLTEDILRQYSSKETESRIEEIDVNAWANAHSIPDTELESCIKYKKNKETGEREFNGYSTKKAIKKFNISLDDQIKFLKKIVVGSFSQLDNHGLLCRLEDDCKTPQCPVSVRLKYQLENLGYVEYTNPELDIRYVAVFNLNTKYSPKFQAYCLKTGETCEMKVHARKNWKDKSIKTSWKELPFVEGDILYLKKCSKKPKQRKNGDEWEIVPGEYIWWIDDYIKLDKNI